MIFRNPWAWIGLVALAGPVAAHLLARRPARRQPFPDLRFLPQSRPRPVRLDRLADAALLAVRAAIVAAAVAALAQPVWLTSARARDLDAQVARAIVLDLDPDTTPAAVRAAAFEAAARASDGATRARTAPRTAHGSSAAALAAAVNWLETQPMRRELIVVRPDVGGAVTRADFDAVPKAVGVRLVAPAAAGETPGTGKSTRPPAAGRAAPAGADTGAWAETPARPGEAGTRSAESARASAGERAVAPAGGEPIDLVSVPGSRAAVEAARAAALATGAPATGRPDRPVAIVFPDAPDHAALDAQAGRLTAPWMFDVFAAVVDDARVMERARQLERDATDLVTAAGMARGGRETLHLIVHAPPHDVAAAAILAAAMRAVAAPASAGATPPAGLSPDDRAAIERPAAPVPVTDAAAVGDLSDARWVWVLVLVLFGLETVLRRRQRSRERASPAEVPLAPVA